MKNNRLWNVSEGGDILRNDLHSDTKNKYKPDLAVDKSFIPYLVMALCAAIDLVFFISLAIYNMTKESKFVEVFDPKGSSPHKISKILKDSVVIYSRKIFLALVNHFVY